MKYLYLLLCAFSLNMASCQNNSKHQGKERSDCEKYDYCFRDSLMFYKGKQFELYGNIDDYIKVFGPYDRKVEDIDEEAKVIIYFFKNNIRGRIGETSANVFIEKSDGEKIEKLQNIEQSVKHYGMYDSVQVKKYPATSEKRYVWDKAGFKAWAINDTIKSLTLEFSKGISFQDSLYTKEENKKIREMEIWTPFSGKISFDGKIINVGLPNPDSWNASITKIVISGEDYDPEGDSRSSMRKVIRWYNNRAIRFDFMRNLRGDDDPDMIQKILISTN